MALAAGIALIVFAPADDTTAVPSGPVAITDEYPRAARADIPGTLPDGPVYQPAWFLDAGDSIGTAPSPDGTAQRVVRRTPTGTVTELHRTPLADTPQYGGWSRDGDTFLFTLTTPTRGTTLFRADLGTPGSVRALTSDTGRIAFFASRYDVVVADGRARWVAVAPGDEVVTELRSVALTGGPVTARKVPAAWAQSAWPWLVSATSSGQSGPVQVRDQTTMRGTTVASTGTELATCSATWCRVVVLGANGPIRIDLMRPDGTDRRRIAGPEATAATVDVALLDRFEVLTVAGASENTALYLFDLTTRKTVQVATGVGVVQARANILWWSTGDVDDTTWHTLDLGTV